MAPLTRMTDRKARVSLPQSFANATVIIEQVSDPINAVNQLTIAAAKAKGMEVQGGDELVFQIFYRDEDAAEAKAQAKK